MRESGWPRFVWFKKLNTSARTVIRAASLAGRTGKLGPPRLTPLSLTEERRVATMLADTRIFFSGVPAPLIYVSDKQSSAIVPSTVVAQHFVEVQVQYQGVLSNVVTAPVVPSHPGIFTADGSGSGQGQF